MWGWGTDHTLKELEVDGISTSGGKSEPGGHGIEKLLFRYWPLIASSTRLSINITTTANQSSATVEKRNCLLAICLNAETDGHLSHLCLLNTSSKDISEPYRVSFQCFRVPREYVESAVTERKGRQGMFKAQNIFIKVPHLKKSLTVVSDVEAVLAYSSLSPAPNRGESPICESWSISGQKKKKNTVLHWELGDLSMPDDRQHFLCVSLVGEEIRDCVWRSWGHKTAQYSNKYLSVVVSLGLSLRRRIQTFSLVIV